LKNHRESAIAYAATLGCWISGFYRAIGALIQSLQPQHCLQPEQPRPASTDMSTVRGARPLIEKGCLLLRPRDFHATPFIRARPAPKRSPKVRATNPPAGGLRIKRTYDYEESLPPIALLNAARKSGALAVEPDQALEFLREYQALAGKSNAGWEQRLCNGAVSF
jgi:hypothetical protein